MRLYAPSPRHCTPHTRRVYMLYGIPSNGYTYRTAAVGDLTLLSYAVHLFDPPEYHLDHLIAVSARLDYHYILEYIFQWIKYVPSPWILADSLIFACKRANTKSACVLIKAGANVNYDSGSALIYSVIYNCGCIPMLIAAGCDLDAQNSAALKHACEYSNLPVVKMLIEGGCNVRPAIANDIFGKALFAGNFDVARHLLSEGIVSVDAMQGKFLIRAARKNMKEVVDFLLRAGATMGLRKTYRALLAHNQKELCDMIEYGIRKEDLTLH